MAKVTVIPASINPLTRLPVESGAKRRVAGYARVSTDSDEQYTSYEAQVDYYTKFINKNPDWKFVRVYTDEGISGTNTKKREGFKEMIKDALDGKIDLIVTKSVSRFARNTVDSLVTIRKLKEKGVECYFEKENIYTLDSKGELLITIMSSLAQEESRSISENITWGQRKSFSDGKVHLAYSRFLGYEKGDDGKPAIIEEEAEIVRLIYRLFLNGHTSSGICKCLERKGILTPSGKAKWHKSTIDSILTNEKYKGDALLQKTFTLDFLEKKIKKNEGEVPQYYVENSHTAIIEPDEWDQVQVEMARRAKLGRTYSSKNIFAAKLICEDCGGFYGQKIWHSNDEYRRVIWHCNNKFHKNKVKCGTPTLKEDAIKNLFIKGYNELMCNRSQVIEDCELMRSCLTNFEQIDSDIKVLTNDVEVIAELVKNLVKENASTPQSQEEYLQKYEGLSKRYEEAKSKLDKLKTEKQMRKVQDSAMSVFIHTIKNQPLVLNKWDDTIWSVMVEKGIVHRDGSITFRFYNASKLITD